MNKLAFYSGYLNKQSFLRKEILHKALPALKKGGIGALEGAALGGIIGPTAAYLSGDTDDIKKQTLMGVTGGAGAGLMRPFVYSLWSSPDPKKKALAYGLMTASGIGTAVGSRKLAQHLKLLERREKWRETYHANKEKREKEQRKVEREERRAQRKGVGVSEVSKDTLSVSNSV